MPSQNAGLKKVGEYWHYNLKVNGQRAHGSTRAKDIATARRVLEERRKALLEGQCGIRRVPTMAELVGEWSRTYRLVYTAKHVKEVAMVFRNWVGPAIGTSKVNQVSTGDVWAIRSKMLEAGRSPVTINDMLKILKLLGNFAIKQGYFRQLPFKIQFLRVQKKPRPILAAASTQSFLALVDQSARNPHIPVMLRVMVGLGMRESEVLGMRWEWFDPAQHTYIVGKAKGKEARVIPVPDWLWNAIHVMPKTLSEWVFPAEDGKPHRPQFCKKVLQRVCMQMRLGNVTQHRLRATFASLHAEAGTPITEIQGMLGHKNISTTMIYVETSLDAKRRAQDMLSQKLGLA